DRAERHRVATDVDGVLGVAGLYVELAGRLGDLFEDPLGIEEHRLVLDLLARLTEQRERPVAVELDPDLGDQATPAGVQLGHRVLGEDLVARHGVAEHGLPPTHSRTGLGWSAS